jgi:hypothetical protein
VTDHDRLFKELLTAALMAKMRIAPGDRPRVKAACLRLDEAEARLFLAEVDRSEPLERTRVMEMVTSWMEEGILKGREEGRAQGREEGREQEARRMTLRQLARKVGPIAEPLLTQLLGLAAADLEDLAEALLDFASQDDLARWLAARR